MKLHLIAPAVVGVGISLGAATLAAQTGPGSATPLVQPTSTSRVGTRGANFLEIGQGARAMGMAGGYAAVAEGISAMYWNLAGTADLQGVAGGISVANLYGKNGLTSLWGGALVPLAGGAFGIQIGQVSSGDIERTTTDFPEGNDPTYGRTFTYTGSVGGISYARRLTDRLSAGGGVKYASEGIADATASYVGLDVGLRFRTGLYGSTIGAALANVGTSGKFSGNALRRFTNNVFTPGTQQVDLSTNEYELPTTFRFSVMTDVFGSPEALMSTQHLGGSLKLVGEVTQAINSDFQSVLAAEYSYRDLLFLRGGRRWLNEEGFRGGQAPFTRSQYWQRGLSLGGGLRLPLAGRRVQFDYAWQGTGELPSNDYFGFEFGF